MLFPVSEIIEWYSTGRRQKYEAVIVGYSPEVCKNEYRTTSWNHRTNHDLIRGMHGHFAALKSWLQGLSWNHSIPKVGLSQNHVNLTPEQPQAPESICGPVSDTS